MQSINRRHTLRALGAAAATLSLSPWALAQQAGIPATVKLVVPFPAGGAVDVVARKMAEAMAKHMGNTFIVENKPGASGAIAARAVAMAQADGSTLLYAHSGLVTAQAMGAKMDLLKDFRPVAKFTAGPHLLVVRSDSAYKTQQDLVDAIKANPGKLNFGSGGPGSPTHLMYEMLEEAVPGIKATHIPFKGAIEAVTALVGGEIDFQFALPGAAMEFIKSGKLRPLAVFSATRSPALPDVPTMKEAGVEGLNFNSWAALLAPAGTPKDIVTKLHTELSKIVATQEIRDRLANLDYEVVNSTPEQLAATINDDVARWQKIVKETNYKVSQ